MKNLFTAILLFMFFSAFAIVNAQPVISSPTDYTIVDETAILTITFADADNAGPSTYTATFTELAGPSQLASSPLSGSVSVPGLVSSGAGPFTIDVPATSLADNTVYTLTIDNTSDGVAGFSVATINVSTGTVLAAGTTTAPASPATLNPDVSWSDATGGFPPYAYDVYINDATGSAHAGDIESSLTETSPYTTTLVSTYNEDYFAIIAATDAASSTLDYSEVSFTTEIATPVITAPSSGDNRISLTPTITWTFAGNTTGVTFTINIDDATSGFGSIEYTAIGLTGTSHVVGTPLDTYNHTYYVRVRAIKGGEDNASATEDFITVYGTPTLVSPINDAKDVNIAYDVYFDWSTSSGTPNFYQVQIDDNSDFSSTEIDTETVGATDLISADLAALDHYTTYYWRVRALETSGVGTGNWSDWSSSFYFRTIDNYNPVLFFPSDLATDIPNSSVTLGWGLTQRLDYASFLFPKFKIVYDTDGAFTPGDGFDPVVVSGVSVTVFFLGLDPGQTYYWKVITVKASNEGESYQTPISSGALTIGTTYRVTVAGTTDLSGVGGPAVPVIGNEFTVTATSVAALTPTWDATTEVIVAGDVGESATWSFTTSGAVVQPTIAYPKDETTVYSQTPILYWYTTGFNTIHEYEIEWTDDPSGSPLSADGTAYATIPNPKKTAIPGLFGYPTPALDGGKHYYWHVRTIIGTIVSDWSDTEDFFTFDGIDAAKPNPAYPTGGVEVYSKFPRLYWTLNGPSQGLTYYVIYGPTLTGGDEVDTSGVLGTAWFKITDISQLYVTLYDGIEGGQTYYWQVRSWNGSAYSDFSDYAEFKIYNFSADLIPILSWPIGGNLVYLTDVNFAWHVEGPSLGITYEMDIAIDATGGTDVDGVADHTGLTSNLLTLSLTAGTSYEWRVRVEGETTWSDIETFTVISGSGSTVPVLNWPVGGATVWSTSQDLGWSLIGGGSPTFEVQVFTDAGLTTHFTGSPFTAVASSPLTLTGLTAGATYYWKVRVEPSEPWSNVEVFIVFAGLSPEAPPTLAAVPRLGSPIDGVEVSSSSPTLSFFSPAYTEGQITYDVEYSQNADFSASVVKTDLAEPRYNAEGLSNGTWYWRARGKDAEGTYSGYSDQGTFKVTGVTGVESEEGLPQNYELSQNYPNPFNPSTMIKFSLPEANHVTLKIYNMLGQEVRTLLSEQANAGVYRVTWNGKDNFGHSVSSGAYIYQIISGNFIATRKMILLK